MQTSTEIKASVDVWASGPKVWMVDSRDKFGDYSIRFDTPAEIDELMAALQAAKQKAFPQDERHD